MKLHYNTVSPILLDYLKRLMQNSAFNCFYLAGGTSLALQRGHRMSIDIDLFTDIDYGSMETEKIKSELNAMFPYTEKVDELEERQMLYTVYIGDDKDSIVKLDLCYDQGEPISHPIIIDGLRLADERDIAAMKIEATLQQEQRRKDFWDIHDLLESYTVEKLLSLHKQRYPYSHDRETIADAFSRCRQSTDMTEVICLKGKYWEFIAEDIVSLAPEILRLNQNN